MVAREVNLKASHVYAIKRTEQIRDLPRGKALFVANREHVALRDVIAAHHNDNRRPSGRKRYNAIRALQV